MRRLALLLLFALVPGPLAADVTGPQIVNPYGALIEAPVARCARPLPWLELAGQFRLRGSLIGTLDLGRGPLPSTGRLLGGGGPATAGETVGTADMRFLFDPTIVVGSAVRIGMRFGFFENLVLGSTPAAYPASPHVPMATASTSQVPPRAGHNSLSDSVVLHRLWLEWLSPIGLIVAGRMGSDWGLGMVANRGSCWDCDVQQVVDRVGLVVSLFDLLWLAAFDFDASGAPLLADQGRTRAPQDLTDRDDVNTVTLAVSHIMTPEMAHGRLARGGTAFLWGLAAAYRFQQEDLPGYYFTDFGEWKGFAEEGEFVKRGMQAVLLDGWFRLWHPRFRIEAEAAYLWTRVSNASLMAGLDLKGVSGHQWGAVLRGAFLPRAGWELRLEAGVASGDRAWGFGANPGSVAAPQPGDLDGAQTDFARDRTVNNFRFHPNYHVDELLWRRIVGTVTDAFYLRPEVRYAPLEWLRLDLALVYSRTLFAESAPGLARDLGVETIFAVNVVGLDGLFGRVVAAWLHPLAGFRNPHTGQSAAGAWALRAAAGVRF
jgi:uncharacterized protein (TIGR04551 family)